MAMAICWAHGLPASIQADVASEIMFAACRAPRDKFHALAHRIASRALARDLGLAQRKIPVSRIVSNAVAQYEHARRMREIWQRTSGRTECWVGGFDYHSRQFAIENGVCPRCGLAGDFRDEGGVCECGFSF